MPDVYTELKQGIVAGQFMPNERLVENDLATQLGVGRIAIRTALTRLEQDGLINREPNRGARVRRVTEKEAVEILEARAVLEGLAARRAAERATDAEIEQLRAIHQQLEQHCRDGALIEYSQTNGRLHALIVQVADHPIAARLIEGLQSQNVRFQFRTILATGRPQHSLREHGEIVDAIARHDPEDAEAAMRTHLSKVVMALRAVVKERYVTDQT
jgi:DNA-binding GntR family transcriptional regulator